MLEAYHHLKATLAERGYETALEWVESQPTGSAREELLQTNLYCYLTIQRGYKASQTLTILQNTLNHPQCRGAIRALTRYHICQIYFPSDVGACGRECEEIIGEFIGAYHMAKELLEPTPSEQDEYDMLQYVIHYCFMLLGWVRGKEGKLEESESYVLAGKNIGRKDAVQSTLLSRPTPKKRMEEVSNLTY